MMMDIACPAELLRVEQARFGEGRRQAYLTMLNESPQTIVSLSGRITLLDEGGNRLERRVVAFSGFAAGPLQQFTCHLALDGYPEFESAQILVEQVVFQDKEIWALNEARVMDCTPPVLENGPERIALIAIAGHDAACFPERHGTHWICVCGRFNRWRWSVCRRCQRARDEVMEDFTPERVKEAYARRVEAERQADFQRLRMRAEEQVIKPPPAPAPRKKSQKRKMAKASPGGEPMRADAFDSPRPKSKDSRVRAGIFSLLFCLLMGAMLVWGVLKIAERSARLRVEAGIPESYAQPSVDYLEPI